MHDVRLSLQSYVAAGRQRWDYIVPGRNFLFLTLANALIQQSTARRGELYICSHKDEMKKHINTDKSQYFFAQTSRIFSQYDRKPVRASTPFAHISKAEILSYWRRHWEKKFHLSPYHTTTCYYDRLCGRCEVCLKRTIVLLASGYAPDSGLSVHPMRDPSGYIVKKYLPGIRKNQFTRVKKYDFLIAVKKSLPIVSATVRKYYQSLSPRTRAQLKYREREIATARLR
jgi:hypothetical protein